MRWTIMLAALILLCGIVSGAHYIDVKTKEQPIEEVEDPLHFIIVVLVWDNNSMPEGGVSVTFANHYTYQTDKDGSVCFDTANLAIDRQPIAHGDGVSVSCKYGANLAIVSYNNGYTGITFNEPDIITAIEAFAALGFMAIAIGGGRYLLRKRKSKK
jgi:hypothetical protein